MPASLARIRRPAAFGLAVALGLLVAGCGQSGDSAQTAPAAQTSELPTVGTGDSSTQSPTSAATPSAEPPAPPVPPAGAPPATKTKAPQTRPPAKPQAATTPKEQRTGPWRTVFWDGFDNGLGPAWEPYDGKPGGDKWTTWQPRHVQVDDGILRLGAAPAQDGHWTAGGMSASSTARQYGRWQVRMRTNKHDVTDIHVLLWPKNEVWPPELDMFETWDSNRQDGYGFMHYRDHREDRQQHWAKTKVDFTQWHIVSLEWTPNKVRYLVDGKEWASFDRNVPHTPMWLALQVQANSCDRSKSSSKCWAPAGTMLEVDWVQIDEYAP